MQKELGKRGDVEGSVFWGYGEAMLEPRVRSRCLSGARVPHPIPMQVQAVP
jgi:hypothetical protein